MFLAPRQAYLGQLAGGRLAVPPEHGTPYCFALDRAEARAEKVRAAFDRVAIRDFYDLGRLRAQGEDFVSAPFVDLVDRKLAEAGRPPLAQQPPRFGKTDTHLAELDRQIDRNLTAVVRQDEPRFDLGALLADLDSLWGK